MKKLINLSEKITLGLCLVSICGFIFNLIFYITLSNKTINSEDILALTDKMGIYVGIVFIIFVLFHLSAVLIIILELKFFNRENIFRAFMFFLSIISLIMVFGDFALLSDITKEYNAGLPGIESEFIVLYFSQALHILFFILIIVLLILTKRAFLKKTTEEIAAKDEAIFINAQYIGIFTGALGLIILTALSIFTPLWAIKKGIIIICILMVLPYASIAVYWLIIKAREKIHEWYDEKQFQDVTKASFISFISSVVILAVFFLIQNLYTEFNLMNVIWFPLYFFTVLLIFSGSILYFSKKSG